MGTNYYHHAKTPCPTCGHEDEPRHIGKSSCGCAFALHVYPDDGIHDLADWQPLFETGRIVDEYGRPVTLADMLAIIKNRSHPRGLRRGTVDDRYCIGHGEGTWDLYVGEFS